MQKIKIGERLQQTIKVQSTGGHCLVPNRHKEENFNLGRWVGNQRSNKSTMHPERIQKLDELGFIWDVLAEAWETGFSKLMAFKEREGHCKVPSIHKEDGFNLGQWVSTQKNNRTKKGMPAERLQRLREIGLDL